MELLSMATWKLWKTVKRQKGEIIASAKGKSGMWVVREKEIGIHVIDLEE